MNKTGILAIQMIKALKAQYWDFEYVKRFDTARKHTANNRTERKKKKSIKILLNKELQITYIIGHPAEVYQSGKGLLQLYVKEICIKL